MVMNCLETQSLQLATLQHSPLGEAKKPRLAKGAAKVSIPYRYTASLPL
jgi:hypothetical protein